LSFIHFEAPIQARMTCNKASVSRILWFALPIRSQLLITGLGIFTMAGQNTWFWGFCWHNGNSYENYDVYKIG